MITEKAIQIMHTINQAIAEGKGVWVGSRQVQGAVVDDGELYFWTPTKTILPGWEMLVIRAFSPVAPGEYVIYSPVAKARTTVKAGEEQMLAVQRVEETLKAMAGEGKS